MSGPLALVGGDEFKPGNEEQDRELVRRRRPGPAYVLPTAAARTRPDLAVRHAQAWFAGLDLEVEELPVLNRTDAQDPDLAHLAARGGFFYLVGGDPGFTATTLRDSAVWRAVRGAWAAGAALAGSSAGAMALGDWTLIRRRFPGHDERRYRDALGVVPGLAVAPHFDTFGERWIPSALEDPPVSDPWLLGVDERSAAFWDGQGWRALGPGRVVVVHSSRRQEHRSGERIELPAPVAP